MGIIFCKVTNNEIQKLTKKDISVVIGVLNQKGGVGKTTLSVNLASGLTKRGKHVLLIDADPQGSALDWASVRKKDSLFSVVGFPRPTLHKDIRQIGQDYEYIIIDGPPRVTDLVRSAIMASDFVLIPVQPSPYDIWAAEEIVQLIQEALLYKENLKSFFLVNRKIINTAIGRDIIDSLSQYTLPTLASSIAQRIVFAESVTQGLCVHEMVPNNPAIIEIENLITEILGHLE